MQFWQLKQYEFVGSMQGKLSLTACTSFCRRKAAALAPCGQGFGVRFRRRMWREGGRGRSTMGPPVSDGHRWRPRGRKEPGLARDEAGDRTSRLEGEDDGLSAEGRQRLARGPD